MKKIKNNFKNFIRRISKDDLLRTHITLYFSLIINMFYAGINLFAGILTPTAWFFALFGYYAVLAIMRFILLRFFITDSVGEHLVTEHRRAALCGKILIIMNFSLSSVLGMTVYKNKGYRCSGVIIYAVAVYTIYVMIASLVNIIKYRRLKSPILFTAKIISFSAALVSLFNLTGGILNLFFSSLETGVKQGILFILGAMVSVIIIAMAFVLMLRSFSEINRLKNVKK